MKIDSDKINFDFPPFRKPTSPPVIQEVDTEKPPVTPQRDLGHETSVTHLPEPVTSMHQTLYHNHTKLIQTLNENEYEMFMFRKDRFLRPFSLPEPISSTRIVITGRDPIPVKEK